MDFTILIDHSKTIVLHYIPFKYANEALSIFLHALKMSNNVSIA